MKSKNDLSENRSMPVSAETFPVSRCTFYALENAFTNMVINDPSAAEVSFTRTANPHMSLNHNSITKTTEITFGITYSETISFSPRKR